MLLSYYIDPRSNKGLFKGKEVIFLLLIKVNNYFTKAYNKEVNLLFLILIRYYILNKFFLLPFYYIILLYTYYSLRYIKYKVYSNIVLRLKAFYNLI